MFNISQYLERFKNIGGTERGMKEAVCLSVKEVVGIDIEAKNIEIINGELLFKISPAMKNAIFIKKEKILAKIKEKNPVILNDIR